MKMPSPHLLRATRLGLSGLAGLLTLGALTAGCGPGFDPYNRLNSLRVLAIRSEPVAPAPGEETTIDAKVYTPPLPPGTTAEPITYAWSWCPFAGQAGAPCPISEADLSALAGTPVPPYDRGTDPTATFPNTIPPAVLAAACAGQPGLPAPDCSDGFPIQIKLIVSQGIQEVQAVRPLRLRFQPGDQANANPTVSGLYAILDGLAVPFDATPPPMLPRHVKTDIGVVIADGDSESYDGKDNDGNAARVQERLNVSWFVETGDTDHQRTASIPGTVTLDPSLNKWTPGFHKDYMSGTAQVIVIIRDDREGNGWTEGSVTLKETP